jgi:hypothetical protein
VPAGLGVAETVVVVPTQILLQFTVTVGLGLIVTAAVVAEFEQPAASLAVKVNVPAVAPIVTLGLCVNALGEKVTPAGPVHE